MKGLLKKENPEFYKGLRSVFFPNDPVLFFVLFVGWMSSFMLLAISFKISNTISYMGLSISAIPLSLCYFLNFLNFHSYKTNAGNEIVQSEQAQAFADSENDDPWEPEIYHHLEKIEWDDVILQEEVKREIKRALVLMIEPEKFIHINKKAPKGLLLYGPPGTGKTTIAKVIASQANMSFFSTSPGELLNGVYGASERRIRTLFRKAKAVTPCVIFIDEIDALLMRRGSNIQTTFKDDILTEFLKEMDGVTSEALQGKVIIIGATNRRDRLDEAALRPGRFDKQIEIPLPDESLRERLWKLFIDTISIKEGPIDYSNLAKLSKNFSGAEIQGAVEEAKDKLIDRLEFENKKDPWLTAKDLVQGIGKIRRNKLPDTISQSV